MMNEITKATSNLLSSQNLELFWKKNGPHIKFGLGLGGVIAGTVLACFATKKSDPIIEEHKAKLTEIKNEQKDLTEEQLKAKKDEYDKRIATTYIKTGGKLAKTFGPAFLVEATGVLLLCSSHKDMSDANAGLAVALANIGSQFKEYREGVKGKYGAEADHDIFYGVQEEEVEEVTVDENGEEIIEKKTIKTPTKRYGYSCVFDCGSQAWSPVPPNNVMFLKQQEMFANQKLQARARQNGGRGYLFLNEVLEPLFPGQEPTKVGQMIGWVYDEKNPVGDNYVDFGIFYSDESYNKKFLSGSEVNAWLNFNCDGNILKLM